MAAEARFSPKEAAVLADMSEKAIRHEMARDIAKPARLRVGKAARRRLTARDVFYLNLVASLPVRLDPEDRRDLYAMITRGLREKGRWKARRDCLRLAGPVDVEIDTAKLRQDTENRLRLYRRGLRRIVSRPDLVGGEPVFTSTRISVRHIGLLAKKGVSPAEILEDYPALTVDDVEFARLYVDLRPDPGRPRKRLGFVRAA